MATSTPPTAHGYALLIAADPPVRRALPATTALPQLAAVPPAHLVGAAYASAVQLANPDDPNTVLTHIRTAAAVEGPLLIYVAGHLQVDSRQGRPHLALARTAPRTVRYTALPWHWLTAELRHRPPGSTTVLADLAAAPEVWQQLAGGQLSLGGPFLLYGTVQRADKRHQPAPAYTQALTQALRATPRRPGTEELHQHVARTAALDGAGTLWLGGRPAPDGGPGAVPPGAGVGPVGAVAPGGLAPGGAASGGAAPAGAAYGAPAYEGPVYGAPVYEAPAYGAPAFEAPAPHLEHGAAPVPAQAPAPEPAAVPAPEPTPEPAAAFEPEPVSGLEAEPTSEPTPTAEPSPAHDFGAEAEAGPVAAREAKSEPVPAPKPEAESVPAREARSEPEAVSEPEPVPTPQSDPPADYELAPAATPPAAEPPAPAPATPAPATPVPLPPMPARPPIPVVAAIPPLPGTVPADDPHHAVFAAAAAGRHGEAAAMAAAWEQAALRSHGPVSREAVHWIEVQAELARQAEEPVRASGLWMRSAHVRLAGGQSETDPEVTAAVDRAHHCWHQVTDRGSIRELGVELANLRGRVPGKSGARDDVQRRLAQLTEPAGR